MLIDGKDSAHVCVVTLADKFMCGLCGMNHWCPLVQACPKIIKHLSSKISYYGIVYRSFIYVNYARKY